MRAARAINMAALNARSVTDGALRLWLLHPIAAVREIAAAEIVRRKAS